VVEDIAFPPSGTPVLQCSARRCRAAAAYQLRWNNPRIHPAEARKTWLACPDHRESLSDFLRARQFLREVEPFPPEVEPFPPEVEPLPAAPGPVADAAPVRGGETA
jgi:hypothetical protein